jgi:hypothetical protein
MACKYKGWDPKDAVLQKRKRTIDEVKDEDLELPALPPTRPPEI